jgi:hypothetical protein
MDPEKLFPFTLRCVRWGRLPISTGRDPEMRLNMMLMVFSDVARPISVGNVPEISLYSMYLHI